MRRKSAIIFLMTTMLAFSACTNPANVTVNLSDKDDNSNAHANIVSTTDVPEVVYPPESNPENVDPDNPGQDNPGQDNNGPDNNGPDTNVLDDSWKKVYTDYLENDLDDLIGSYDPDWANSWTFGFIYVNEDNIPEMVISAGYEAGGNVILTIINGEVFDLSTRRLGFYYDERNNILVNSDGHMGVYFDYVYTITDYGFESLANGEYYDEYDDENGYTGRMDYYLNGDEVSEEEYYEVIDLFIPLEDRTNWSSGSTYKSVMDYLKGNDYVSAKEAYKSVVEEMFGAPNVHFALLEFDKYNTYLLMDNNNWVYVYYYQDGVPFRGADFYASTVGYYELYPLTGDVISFYESSYDMGVMYYIYTSNMGSTYVTYAGRGCEFDENGELCMDEEGNYKFTYYINSTLVSEMEYAEFLDRFDGDYVVITSAELNDGSSYEYYTPEEMYDFLGR